MKPISFSLIIAAVIQIALTAPASDVPTTTITPLGPMNMDQLAEFYLNFKFHRYDDVAPATISLIKTLLKKLDDIIASPDNSYAEKEIYQQFRSHYTDYLKDVEVDTTECSLKQVGHYYHHRIEDFVTTASNVKVKEIFESFNSDQTDSLPLKSFGDVKFIYENQPLLENIKRETKFSTRCCKYWNKSNHKGLINGEC